MGCFLACFGSDKNRKRRKPGHKVSPRRQRSVSYEPLKSNDTIKQEIVKTTIRTVTETRDESGEKLSFTTEKIDKIEEQLSFGTRKKVTFDLNVKAYEEVVTQEYAQSDDEEEEKGKKEDKIAKQIRSTSVSEDSSNSSSSGSFPSNHRYGNCTNSDDEYEEMESDESDFDDDEDDDDDDYEDDDDEDVVHRIGEPESSGSLFSLPVGSRTSATPAAEKEVNSPLKCNDDSVDEEKKTLGSNRNARDRSQYVHSVLNPVENLSQWKAVKAKIPTPLKQDQRKENINLESEPKIPFSAEPTFKLSPFSFNSSIDHSSPPSKQEIAVDASLSTWLGSSESTPSIKSSNISIGTCSAEVNKSPRSYSPRSHEDRPILGALTVEELKQHSATSSPRKSPTHTPDEMPILGTVGSYWSHTNQASDSSSGTSSCKGIPNTTSKYREDKRVNWHSTPFEQRLERALNKGAAEGY